MRTRQEQGERGGGEGQRSTWRTEKCARLSASSIDALSCPMYPPGVASAHQRQRQGSGARSPVASQEHPPSAPPITPPARPQAAWHLWRLGLQHTTNP